jgi:hypothetical protein
MTGWKRKKSGRSRHSIHERRVSGRSGAVSPARPPRKRPGQIGPIADVFQLVLVLHPRGAEDKDDRLPLLAIPNARLTLREIEFGCEVFSKLDGELVPHGGPHSLKELSVSEPVYPQVFERPRFEQALSYFQVSRLVDA